MSTSWARRDIRRVCRTPVRLSVQRLQDARQPVFEGARVAESNGEPKVVEPARFMVVVPKLQNTYAQALGAHMRIDRLVSMINDIATFFAADPEPGVAARAVESHISRFWEPRMRHQILEHYRRGGSGLTEVSRSALVLLAAEGSAAPALHANEDGTGGDAG
jgi:formate dehydrogenase subunit delta